LLKRNISEEIRRFLEEKIKNVPPGEIFTTEVEIATSLGLSRPTVRKHTKLFYEEGFIECIAGKGIAAGNGGQSPKKRTIKNYLILVSFTGRNDDYFADVIRGITDVLNEYGDNYRICMNVKYAERLEFIKSLDISNFDGIFISLYEDEASYEIVNYLEENGLDIILVDNQLSSYNLNCVKNDDVDSGYSLGKYIGENNLNPIFLLSGKREASTNVVHGDCQGDKSIIERAQGVQYGLKAFNKKIPDNHFFRSNDFENILDALNECDTIIFHTTTSVLGFLNFLKEAKPELFEKINVCVFGDSVISDFIDGIFVVHDGYTLGCRAARLSDKIVDGITVTESVKSRLVAVKNKIF